MPLQAALSVLFRAITGRNSTHHPLQKNKEHNAKLFTFSFFPHFDFSIEILQAYFPVRSLKSAIPNLPNFSGKLYSTLKCTSPFQSGGDVC